MFSISGKGLGAHTRGPLELHWNSYKYPGPRFLLWLQYHRSHGPSSLQQRGYKESFLKKLAGFTSGVLTRAHTLPKHGGIYLGLSIKALSGGVM